MANGNDIIIKGSSAEIQFDHDLYPQDPGNPKRRKHDNLKITRIVISGNKDFDSGEIPNGFKGQITISCR